MRTRNTVAAATRQAWIGRDARATSKSVRPAGCSPVSRGRLSCTYASVSRRCGPPAGSARHLRLAAHRAFACSKWQSDFGFAVVSFCTWPAQPGRRFIVPRNARTRQLPTFSTCDAIKAISVGGNVSEVLAGAMPGIPLRWTTGMSHIELKNGLMSRQKYRNYTNLMEAELAALKDLGCTIDRRNFFGYSLYGSGQNLVNDDPFFSRNAGRTAYLPNTDNTATLELGLHVLWQYGGSARRPVFTRRRGRRHPCRRRKQFNSNPARDSHRCGRCQWARHHVHLRQGAHITQRGDVQAVGNHGIAASFFRQQRVRESRRVPWLVHSHRGQ